MERIILINLIDEKADVPAQLFPIFGIAVKKVDHRDNRNDEKVAPEEREKVTRTTWDVIALVSGGAVSLFSCEKKWEAMGECSAIISAVDRGQRVYDIDKTDEKEEADAETDRIYEDDGCPRESCYPEGNPADDGSR